MREITEFVFRHNPRQFKIGSRVKIYFKERWWAGTIDDFIPVREEMFKPWFDLFLRLDPKLEVIGSGNLGGVETVIYYDYHDARMLVKADELVDSGTGTLLNGYGIKSGWQGKDIIFEDEPEYTPELGFIFIPRDSNSNDNDLEKDGDLPF